MLGPRAGPSEVVGSDGGRECVEVAAQKGPCSQDRPPPPEQPSSALGPLPLREGLSRGHQEGKEACCVRSSQARPGLGWRGGGDEPPPPVPPDSTGGGPEALSQPLQEEELSGLDLRDVEEAQIGRDTRRPGERAEPSSRPCRGHSPWLPRARRSAAPTASGTGPALVLASVLDGPAPFSSRLSLIFPQAVSAAHTSFPSPGLSPVGISRTAALPAQASSQGVILGPPSPRSALGLHESLKLSSGPHPLLPTAWLGCTNSGPQPLATHTPPPWKPSGCPLWGLCAPQEVLPGADPPCHSARRSPGQQGDQTRRRLWSSWSGPGLQSVRGGAAPLRGAWAVPFGAGCFAARLWG